MANFRDICSYCGGTGIVEVVDPYIYCGAICDCDDGLCHGRIISQSEVTTYEKCTSCDYHAKQNP